jgi:hypothetical protein
MKENTKDNVAELELMGNAGNSENGRVHGEQVKPDRERM